MARARSRASIRKTDYGTFEVRWSYDGPDGKRKQASKSFKTNKEASAFKTLTLRELDDGTHVAPSKYTVAQHLADWIDRYVERECKPNTQKSYRDTVRLHLGPLFGEIALTELTAERIEKVFENEGGDRTTATLHRAYQVLHGAMIFAIQKKRLKINPCDGVTLPKLEKPDEVSTALDADQVTDLLERIAGTTMYLPAFLALGTGMRIGEFAALRWEDVNLDEATIRIQRTMVAIDGEISFGPPKNGRTRIIGLDKDVVEVLRQYKGAQAAKRLRTSGYQDHGLVYPRHDGTPRNLRGLSSTWGWIVREKCLPDIRFHDLRHTHATLLLKAGVEPYKVSKRLGHQNLNYTCRVYAKYLPSMDREAAQALGDLLRRAKIS